MKTKAYVLLGALCLFATAPLYGQGNGNHNGNGHGKGHHSDKEGHNNNGSDKSGHDENGDDHEDAAAYSQLNTQVADAISQLAIGTLRTPEGASIPTSAQAELYVLMTNSSVGISSPPASETLARANQGVPVASPDQAAPTASGFYMALSAAGAQADPKLLRLMESLSRIVASPREATAAIENFNDFVGTASPAFLAKPPAEFVAVHSLLARITAGFTGQQK